MPHPKPHFNLVLVRTDGTPVVDTEDYDNLRAYLRGIHDHTTLVKDPIATAYVVDYAAEPSAVNPNGMPLQQIAIQFDRFTFERTGDGPLGIVATQARYVARRLSPDGMVQMSALFAVVVNL